MTTGNASKYQTDYTYSKGCSSCGARTWLGTEHGKFWKLGDTCTYTCTDCGGIVTSFIYRHKTASRTRGKTMKLDRRGKGLRRLPKKQCPACYQYNVYSTMTLMGRRHQCFTPNCRAVLKQFLPPWHTKG